MLKLIKTKPLIKLRLDQLANSIKSGKVTLPKSLTKFVFLCGANNGSDISERRKALIKFSQLHLPHTQFLLAEKVFETLSSLGSKENILDIEKSITNFADNVLIILESESAFAELGAFSHEESLREKLIVINDEKFKASNSFINSGPIQAIKEKVGDKAILHYKMSPSGKEQLDGIGEVFPNLYSLLKEPLVSKTDYLDLKICDPSTNFNKFSAMLIHDLIYFTGPINHKELIEVLIHTLGDKPYNFTSKHTAILKSFGSITKNNQNLFKSLRTSTYYKYSGDVSMLLATFRNYLQRYYPERIYAYET